MQIKHLRNQTSGVEERTAEEYKVRLVCVLFHGRKELDTRVMHTASFDFRSASSRVKGFSFTGMCTYRIHCQKMTRKVEDQSCCRRVTRRESLQAAALLAPQRRPRQSPGSFVQDTFFILCRLGLLFPLYVRRWWQAGEGGDAYGNVLQFDLRSAALSPLLTQSMSLPVAYI